VVDSGPIAPARTSYVSATARVSAARPSYSFAQRPVVARLNPAVETQRRTPQFTNESREFNQPQNARVNNNVNPQPNPRVGNNNPPPANNQQQSHDGFRPFTPPSGTNNRTTTQPDNRNANQTQARQNEERPAMRFTQPTRARDQMYDVHPPLNHQNQNQPQPRQQEHRSAPPSHSESHPQKK
jgi:hypothetical protein